MVDLNDGEIQAYLRRNARLSILMYALLILALIASVALNLVLGFIKPTLRRGLDWAQITYIVVLSAFFFVMLCYLTYLAVKKYAADKRFKATVKSFVEEKFAGRDDLFEGANVEIVYYVEDNLLTVARQGVEAPVQIDFTPVLRYYDACQTLLKAVQKHIAAYYRENFEEGKYGDVTVVNAIGSKPKHKKLIQNGKAGWIKYNENTAG